MSNTKFTPGIWSVYEDDNSPIISGRFNDENYDIAIIPDDGLPEEMRTANAHVIKAAPAMYEALINIRKQLSTSFNWDSPTILSVIESAIPKDYNGMTDADMYAGKKRVADFIKKENEKGKRI